MRNNLKVMLPFILMCLFFSVRVLFPNFSEMFIDKCSIGYAKTEVRKYLKSSPMDAQKRQVLAFIDVEMKKRNVRAEDKEDFMRDYAVYMYLTESQCDVPEGLLKDYEQ